MKKAFTLVEIIISIVIFSIMIAYMYEAVTSTQKTTLVYERLYEKDKKMGLVKRVFYNDIFNQLNPYEQTNIKACKNSSCYFLRTNNSLHNLASPYVSYALIRETLFRFESAKKFELPLDYEKQKYVKIDKLLDNVSHFMVYANKNDKIITWISYGKKTIFQISLPYNKKVVVVGENQPK